MAGISFEAVAHSDSYNKMHALKCPVSGLFSFRFGFVFVFRGNI